MHPIFNGFLYVVNLPLVPIGKTTLTLAMLSYIIILFTILIFISRAVRQRVLEKLLAKSKLDLTMQNAFAMFMQYSTIAIGAVIILNTAGIEMTALTVVAGAVGIGLSLGLQTIAKSLAGGVMILVERPIRIGDRIQIGTTTGDVTRISLRSTTIRNDDHIDIIVPNADFMEQRVSNWTYSTRDIIVNIPLTVSSENDLDRVIALIEESAKANTKILAEPPPAVLLDSFAAGKMNLIIRIATEDYVSAATTLKSELNTAIMNQFKQAQIKFDS